MAIVSDQGVTRKIRSRDGCLTKQDELVDCLFIELDDKLLSSIIRKGDECPFVQASGDG